MRWFLMAVSLCAFACGGSDQPDAANALDSIGISQRDMDEASRIIDSTLAQMKREEAVTFPCNLFTAADVAQLTGTPADSGSYTFVNRTEDDREWKSEECLWEGTSEQDVDVDVWVSLPKHFTAGQVICHPLIGGQPLSGIGKTASWFYMLGSGIGTLRVCTDGALFEVKVDRPDDDEAAVKRTAQTIANQILEKLPSAAPGSP
jgi:hypothetical protein